MEIQQFQHADFIWTWRGQGKSAKASLWLPYFERVEAVGRGKPDQFHFFFKGGDFVCHLKQLDSIMFYGAAGYIPIEFLDRLSVYKIPLMIHRRNMPSPYLFFPDSGSDECDVLSRQIEARNNQIKQCYIARTLIRERFKNFESLIVISDSTYKKLARCRSIDAIRVLEAELSQRYWREFYRKLGQPDVIRRDKTHPINQALNAGSYFLSGILLRWVLFHKLSPAHGYLHVQTNYPSLVFDLIEPFRYLIEEAVLVHLKPGSPTETNWLTAAVIKQMKEQLVEAVYVPATRQVVRQKNILHGVVLALRAYLLGENPRLVLPLKGSRKGGRPPKINYRLPGEIK